MALTLYLLLSDAITENVPLTLSTEVTDAETIGLMRDDCWTLSISSRTMVFPLRKSGNTLEYSFTFPPPTTTPPIHKRRPASCQGRGYSPPRVTLPQGVPFLLPPPNLSNYSVGADPTIQGTCRRGLAPCNHAPHLSASRNRRDHPHQSASPRKPTARVGVMGDLIDPDLLTFGDARAARIQS